MLQTAEGSLNGIHNILARMRELAVQGASDNLNAQDRSTLNMEYQQLKAEVDRTARSTEYNQIKLIDGSQKGIVSTATGTGIDSINTIDRIMELPLTGTFADLSWSDPDTYDN